MDVHLVARYFDLLKWWSCGYLMHEGEFERRWKMDVALLAPTVCKIGIPHAHEIGGTKEMNHSHNLLLVPVVVVSRTIATYATFNLLPP